MKNAQDKWGKIMKGYKKILALILFALVSVSGALFGCRGRYDGVKITSDKSEAGLQLYLDDEIDDGNNLSVGTITFTISGASNDAISKMKYSFEGNEESKIVKIISNHIQGNSATLTLQAISGGSTKLVAMSEEGGKTCSVKVECIKRVKSMKFNSEYVPAMFNAAGRQLTINTKKIDFIPADTTQNQVTYSLKNAIDGITITPAGIITLEKKVNLNDFVVVATNVSDTSLTSEITVHLVKPLSSDDSDGIKIFCESSLYKDGIINLTTVGEESSVIIRADVDTTEKVTLGYKIDRGSGSINCVNIDPRGGFELGVYANNIGSCTLVLQVYFDNYPELEAAEKEIQVNVVELPTTISVNGIKQDFADEIYTYYQNGLGEEYIINIGDYFAYDKQFVIASDKLDGFEVRRSDGTIVNFGTVDDAGEIGGEFDVLPSNTPIFVKGIAPNVDSVLYIYAHGTLGKRAQLVRTISLKTLLGSEHVEPQYKNLDGQQTKVFYVELGKSFELGYTVDEGTSAKNIRLLNIDGSEVSDYISLDITNSSAPTITVTGEKPGSLSCKLMLDNLVESETFMIYVFVPVNYLNAEKDGGVYFKVDSPLLNRNIAEAVYTQYDYYSSLERLVIALGSTVQLYSNNDPTNATIFDTKYSSVVMQGDQELPNTDASSYVSVYANGYVVAKKVLPESLIENGQSIAIKIEISSLKTENGEVVTEKSTKYICVEGYVPLRDVTISKRNSTIYWDSYELLNPIQRVAGKSSDTVSLSLYPNSIVGSKANISWDCPSELTLFTNNDKTVATVIASAHTNDVEDSAIYTITATIQYYTTTIVRRFTVNVLKAVKAKTLTAYVFGETSENKNTAYFEFNGANQISPASRQIVANVYSKNNVQDVTFDKIYYKSLDESIAVVSEDGVITPVAAGKTYIHVYAEDMMTSVDNYDVYKTIEVIVADGLTQDSALKISTEADFDKIAQNPNLFYYISNDINLTATHFIPEFNGHLEGNNHYINGIVIDEIAKHNCTINNKAGKYIALFGEITKDAVLSELNFTFSLNYDTTNDNIYIAGLALKNNGRIRDVEIYYLNANINVQTDKNIYFAGAVIENTEEGYLTNVSVSANVNITASQDYSLDSLYVGGIVLYNNNYIYGNNDNYRPVSVNAIQEYDFEGKITISNNISATNSAIGGVVAVNNNVIGSTNLGSGFAVDITINAQNIDNVGGIAGVNVGQINNSLAKVDIIAHDNVGGAVGYQYIEKENHVGDTSGYLEVVTENAKLQLDNVVVEMYNNVDGVNYGKVQGNKNVGGLAGNVYGYFVADYYAKNDRNETISWHNAVNYSKIFYSYVYAYSSNSGVFGKDNVGGLVGNARLLDIQKCYANTKIVIENNTQDDKYVGGLVGVAQNLKVDKAYAIVNYQDTEHVIFGSVAGKISQYSYINAYGYTEKSLINQFYSTSEENFVGNGTLGVDYVIGVDGAFDGTSDLKNKNTYPRFRKSTDAEFVQDKIYFEVDTNAHYIKTEDTAFLAGKDYYELINDNYVATEDVVFDVEKDYYEIDVNTYYVKTEDTEIDSETGKDKFDPNKDYYEYVFKIDNEFTTDGLENDWLISESENNGYPSLIYDSLNLMRKLQPTQIFVTCLEKENSIVVNDNLIALDTEKVYRLSDVLGISTDVSSRATIYAYSNKDGVLDTRNTTNRLTNNTTLQSNTEQIVTLTFVLGNNNLVTKSVQIAFINSAKMYSVNDLKIKKGQTENIFANVTFDSADDVEDMIALNSSNYKLGILKSSITYSDNGEEKYYIEISNSITKTIDGKEYVLFSSGSAVLGKETINLTDTQVLLFYELNYSDLQNNAQVEYVQVIKDSEGTANGIAKIKINVYSGATSIYASTTDIDMTIIDEISFTVTIKTDDIAAKLFIDPASEYIYCNQNDLGGFVKLADTATYQANKADAKIELYVLKEDNRIRADKTLEITFALRFADKYFENERFNKEFASLMKFWAQKGYVQEGESDVVSTEINLKAMPQWLLKIDISNYPAGKTDGDTYVPVSVPANTLTPGQVGLMVIDIYPEYAYYDQIEVVSAEDADGNYISFIQVAQNLDYNPDVNSTVNRYVELKPNTNIVDKGLVLMPYSTISFSNEGSYTTTFDGRFYVKTLMGTNVKNQEEIAVTVTGLTYQIDENGNYVLDENGNYIVSRKLVKTLTVVVNPAPEVAISVTDETHTSPVYVKTNGDQTAYHYVGEYNLVLAKSLINMQVELKNGLIATRSEVGYRVCEKININENGEVVNGNEIYNSSAINVSAIDADLSFSVGLTNELKTGNVVEIWVTTYKTINGFTETYISNKQKFLIVDRILKEDGLNVNYKKSKLNFTVNVPQNLQAHLEYTDSEIKYDMDLNDNGAYWAGYNARDGRYYDWASLTKDEEDIQQAKQQAASEGKEYKYNTPTKSFENYLAYKIIDEVDGDGDVRSQGSFGITATNNSVNISKFKVELDYYYVQETDIDNNTTCTLQVVPPMLEGDGLAKEHSKKLVTEIDMDISIKTELDQPLTIYTVEEFCSMTTGLDYILMNDLYFGNVPQEIINTIDDDKWARTYTPFVFDANSFDGNMHKIHFYGNYFNMATDGNGKEIVYVNNREETIANIGLFTAINSEKIIKDVDVIYHAMPSDNDANYAINIATDTTMPANVINFGGLAVTNNGVVSNVFVYYEGDVNINTKSAEGQVNIAGFVYQNSGKITYSSVYGPNWNDNDFRNDVYDYHNIKFQSNRTGIIATFVCTNSYLISNCETSWIGIENTAPASRNAKIAGFVVSNSGRIYNSSSTGQILKYSSDSQENHYSVRNENFYANEINFVTAIGKNDDRIAMVFDERITKASGILNEEERNRQIAYFNAEKNKYFAKLSSNANIAGFVYQNTGEIENAYSSYPMETGARTAGFVFDNSGAGSVLTSYTVCYYDGTNTNNTAYAPFVGTNDLGEVLNDANTSVVKYSYYILEEHEVYEEDVTFKEPASRISLSEEDDSSFSNPNSFVGFDKGKLTSIWNVFDTSDYLLPILNPNLENKLMREGFVRDYIQYEVDGQTKIEFTRVRDESNPYQIADARQFINVFNDEVTWFKNNNDEKISGYLNHSIRLINDIDLSEFAGTDALNNIRKVVYMGDFDGNGMIISGINLVGSEEFVDTESSVENNVFSNVSSSYGLFNQIGTATVAKKNATTGKLEVDKFVFNTKQDKNGSAINKTRIRNLILKVNNVSKSTAAYTGILAGVIINTDIQSVKIQSNNVSVLGKNVVGGLVGGVFGESKLYSVSVNANATSSYQSKANNLYNNGNGFDNITEYSCIDFSTEEIQNRTISRNNYGFGYDENDRPNRIDLASKVLTCSYAGGVAGIVDVYDEEASMVNSMPGDSNESSRILNRIPNIELVTTYGDVSISAEIVGGVIGMASEDAYLGNVSFEVSQSSTQQLAGLFTSGGIVGINNGGIIQLSKVELAQAYAANNDNMLTNQTGNNLFNVANVYPFAVGGLVGVERGGYLITDYSKANVISPNAKYLGGIIGYLTDHQSVFNNAYIKAENIDGYSGEDVKLSELKSGRFVLMEEVYTTGNVFAGDGYSSRVDKEGTPNEKTIFTPTSYAGGIVGCYEPLDFLMPNSTTRKNLDRFNGVMGINAFHIPANYAVSSNYTLAGGGAIKYSDLMNGFENATRTLSNGKIQKADFLPRLGSIFGYVKNDSGKFEYRNEMYVLGKQLYYNLYTNYVYNATTITESICKNPRNGVTGDNLRYIAYATQNATDVTKDLIIAITNNSGVDQFRYSTGSAESQFMNVFINSVGGIGSDDKEYIEPSKAYLVIRALSDYRKYKADENGIYAGWDNNWIFKSPVYPSFKPKDWNEYIDISTESGLRSIRSGNKYRIVSDIYLTHDWDMKSLNHITLISKKRNDGLGIISSNGSLSSYYTIYNINMAASAGNQNSYGFFGELRYSTIKNINFVYGTNIKDPRTNEEYWDRRYVDPNDSNQLITELANGNFGFNYEGNAGNVGLLAGLISRGTTIESCNVFVNTDILRLDKTNFTPTLNPTLQYTIQLGDSDSETDEKSDKNVGGIVGNIRDGSSISGNITFGSLLRTNTNVQKTTMTDADISSASSDYNLVVTNSGKKIGEFNVGGFIGRLDAATLKNDSVSSLALKFNNQGVAESINVGGALGKFVPKDNLSNNLELSTRTSAKIYVQGMNIGNGEPSAVKNLSVGGAFGNISGSINILECFVTCEEIKVNNITPVQDDRDVDSENMYVGGVAGFVTSSNIEGTGNDINVGKINISDVRLLNSYVGGLVGYLDGKKTLTGLSTSTNARTTISYRNVLGNVNIGGAFGFVSSLYQIKNASAYFNTIAVTGRSATVTTGSGSTSQTIEPKLNVAGFVASVSRSSTNTLGNAFITNSFAKGTIDLSSWTAINSFAFKCAGFIADGASTNTSGDSLNKLEIANSVSDVKLKLERVSDNSLVAGFASSGISNFTNCVSLGDIIISKLITESNVLVAGFASYNIPSGSIKANSPCYALSTIKAAANNYSKIVATDERYNSNILYNYNLSGVFSDQAKNYGATQTEIGERSYTELCGSAGYSRLNSNSLTFVTKGLQGILYNIAQSNKQLDALYKNNNLAVNLNYFKDGLKFNPIFASSTIPSITSSSVVGNYYVVTTESLSLSGSSINVNIIASLKTKGVKFTTSNGVNIAENVVVSGLAFAGGDNCKVNTNSGYLFNCVSIGKITSIDDTDISGFVGINEGLINACGSNSYLDADGKRVNSTGFVGLNEGLIANSYATNVFLNTVASTSDNPTFYNVGFVYENTDTGTIANCYSSPSIFDLIGDDFIEYKNSDGSVNIDKTLAYAKNTKIFSMYETKSARWSRGTSETNIINCNAYSTKWTNEHSLNSISYEYYQTYQTPSVGFTGPYKGAISVLYGVTESGKYTSKNGFSLFDENVNYGLTTSLSYNTIVGEDFNLGSLYTGNGTENKPYKINNFKRFSYLGRKNAQSSGDKKTQYIRLVNNIDAFEAGSSSANLASPLTISAYNGYALKGNNNITGLQLTIDNLELYALYNINLAANKSLFNFTGSYGSTSLTIKNLGVVGSGDNTVTKAKGFLVDYVNSLSATNSYVSLKNTVTIGNNSGYVYNNNSNNNSSNSKEEFYYGVFAGKVGALTINGCFANVDMIVNRCNMGKELNVYVGSLIGGATDSPYYVYKINNSFASGTITINNQINDYTKLYVGGLVGAVKNPAFGNCYSNVSLKNRISNEYYKKAFVGAFAGYSGKVTGSAIVNTNSNRNYLDPNICLTNKASGCYDGSDTDNLTGNIYSLTLSNYSVFDGDYATDYTDLDLPILHLPIQSVFDGNRIVYHTLDINGTMQSGSKMSPKKLFGLSASVLKSNKYFYLDSDINNTTSFSGTYDNVTIIGNGKKIHVNVDTDKKYLFNGNSFDKLSNITISGMIVKDCSFLRYVKDSYIYDVAVQTESTNGTVVPGNGVVYYSQNTVYDGCLVKGYYKPKSSSSDAFSAFIYQSDGDTIRNISIIEADLFNREDSITDNYEYDNIAGVVAKLGSNTTSIIGSVRLEIKSNNLYETACFGGVVPEISSSSKINIFADIYEKITVNRVNKGGDYYIGGVIGKITAGGSTFYPEFNIKITDAVINSNALSKKNVSWSNCYVSPVIAYCNANADNKISNISILCSPKITVKADHNRSSYPDIYVGGIVARLDGGKIEGLGDSNSDSDSDRTLKVDVQWGISYIGGIAGYVSGGIAGYVPGGEINNCVVDYALNVTTGGDKGTDKTSNCYVGGVAGIVSGNGKISNSTCKCLVAGLSYSTNAVTTLSVEDARTFVNEDDENKFANANYQKHTVHIPLVVGGIIGYYENGTLSDIDKTKGDVRALIDANSDLDSSNINMNTDWKTDWNGSVILPSTDEQKVNSEKCQARVGAICGLVSDSVAGNNRFKPVGSVKHVYGNNYKSCRVIKLTGENRKNYGSFLKVDYAKTGYYTLEGLGTSDVYYDFGILPNNATNLAKMGTTIDQTAYFRNFNFVQWRKEGDKTSYTEPSKSSFTSTNIFDKDSSDYYLKYDGRYNDSTYWNARYKDESYAANTGNYLYYIDYFYTDGTWNADCMADLNGMRLHSIDLNDIARNNGRSNVKVFAGYRYGAITLNRSFWLVASDLLGGDNDDHWPSDWVTDYDENYKTSLYFYPTQHWAGTVVGGVVY